MRAISLVLFAVLFAPFLTHAETSAECKKYITDVQREHPQDQQSQAPNTAIQKIPPNTPPDKAPKLGHKETNDQVIVNADGSIMVISSCGEKGTIGTISVCTFDKDSKQTCGVKIPKTKEDVVASVASALQQGSGQTVQQSLKALAEAAKNQPAPTGSLPSLNRRQVLDAFKKAGVSNPEAALRQLKDMGYSKEAEQLLAAAAAGDEQKVRNILRPLEQYRSYWPEDMRTFSTNAFLDALDEKRKSAQAALVTPDYFSAMREIPVAEATGFGDIETGSLGQRAPSMVAHLSSQPIPVGAGGRVDPVSFYAHAVQAAKDAGLDGYVDPRLHSLGLLNTGSAEEWGRLYTMMAKQESDFNINSSAPSECSYGILQFCPNDNRYGLYSMQDVRDPQSSLNALVSVTQQGKLFQYFGPIKRGGSEVAKHAAWFDQTVAPQVNGEVPYSPVTNVVGGSYWSGVSSRGSEVWSSPGYYSSYSGNSGSSFTPLSSLFSSLGGGSLYMAPSTNVAPPAPPQQLSAPPITPQQTAIINPVIAFSGTKEIDKGDSLLVAWAATGVSATQPCRLVEDGEVVAGGNSGTYFVPISAVYPDDPIVFTLECTPADSRADQNEARKELKVLVR